MFAKTSTLKLNRGISGMLILAMLLALMAAAAVQPAKAAPVTATCASTHTVAAGETIYRIARNYKVTVNRLARANDLEKPYSVGTGDKLCIPAALAFASGKFTVTVAGDKVFIDGTGFKKNQPFVVKVRADDASPFFKLGKFNTNTSGVMDATFDLPAALEDEVMVTVCLKDGINDGLSCKRVLNQ